MYADHSLTPKEAARLCALGTLADGVLTYDELASSVRYFMDRVQGPTLDVMGSSIELLKYEGLVAAQSGEMELETLEITDEGRVELRAVCERRWGANLSMSGISDLFQFFVKRNCI